MRKKKLSLRCSQHGYCHLTSWTVGGSKYTCLDFKLARDEMDEDDD